MVAVPLLPPTAPTTSLTTVLTTVLTVVLTAATLVTGRSGTADPPEPTAGPGPSGSVVSALAMLPGPVLLPPAPGRAPASGTDPPPAMPPPPVVPRTPVLGGGPVSARWGWPLRPRPVVVARFAAPPGPYAAGHRGVDLAARVGDPVYSPAGGTVAFAGLVAGGPVVVVVHASGLRSTLEPVRATVPLGSRVEPGSAVGVVAAGAGHCTPATCLHWGVLRGRTYLDPLRLVAPPPTVLLPLPP